MPLADPPSGRCGYTIDTTIADETVPAVTCYRPLWDDHDYCVWHARETGKSPTTFDGATPSPQEYIGGAYLVEADLAGIDWLSESAFTHADFTGADLRATDFSGANLRHATFENTNAMHADFNATNLEGAIMEDTDLRGANLREARLNETVFTDVHIDPQTNFGPRAVYEMNDVEPDTGAETHPLRAAAWMYRELQQVYRENSLPKRTRQSYRHEKDARRRLAWEQNDYLTAFKRELSRWVMLYGSSPYRILAVSAIIIVMSAMLYPITGGLQVSKGEQIITYHIDEPTEASRFWLAHVFFRSLYFSIVTFVTTGYGDMQPIGMWTRLLANVEMILGSLLLALLVFVLARSVTW